MTQRKKEQETLKSIAVTKTLTKEEKRKLQQEFPRLYDWRIEDISLEELFRDHLDSLRLYTGENARAERAEKKEQDLEEKLSEARYEIVQLTNRLSHALGYQDRVRETDMIRERICKGESSGSAVEHHDRNLWGLSGDVNMESYLGERNKIW